MTEDQAAALFKAASTWGWKMGIELPGSDSVVPVPGPGGDDDVRVSDSEVVIHEMAHCVLAGIDPSVDPEHAVANFAKAEAAMSPFDVFTNELETMTVTREVLLLWGANADLGAFLDTLDFQTIPHGYSMPIRRRSGRYSNDIEEFIEEFSATERAKAAVAEVDRLLKEA